MLTVHVSLDNLHSSLTAEYSTLRSFNETTSLDQIHTLIPYPLLFKPWPECVSAHVISFS